MESLSRPHVHPVKSRRSFLSAAGLAGLSWLTPVGQILAARAEADRAPAQSVIVLWLSGGPSQLDTFDPKPKARIGGGVKSIKTAVKGVELAEGFERLADQMADVALIRSMISKEGDHERGTYLMKTGFRPETTVEHPSLGAILCHELEAGSTSIPRHVSILPGQWPARGGFLGGNYDAFQANDPSGPLPDVSAFVGDARDRRRVADMDVVERAFARGRSKRVASTLHRDSFERARVMMTSDQLKAFDVKNEPASVRDEYGDSPFGRACLAARRLIEVGVRCVEVTLDGWDSHVNNAATQRSRVDVLDPAFSALIRDLKRRKQLDRTLVLCLGEFGRTPKINPLGGRDHWPIGFSMALAGGGIAGGRVIGETDPEGVKDPVRPYSIADVHATVLSALGINPRKELEAPIGRPVKLCEGKVIPDLLIHPTA
ncbi:MAG: DUF1501 domain-containing protein [Isosphaeraceae bacterium]